jgi:hypothetical protein
MEARHVQKRVVEERLQLMLHAERMTRWVLRQSRMLIDLPSDPHLKPRKIFRNNLKLQLLQRDKVAQSLLGMKTADLLPAERPKEQLELRDLISKVMHRVLKVPDIHNPDDDDDGDDPGEDWQEGDIREEVAAKIAERLEKDHDDDEPEMHINDPDTMEIDEK